VFICVDLQLIFNLKHYRISAGITKRFMSFEDIVNLVVEEAPKKRGSYKKRNII